MKRVFGTAEAVFDICYLCTALALGGLLLSGGGRDGLTLLAGASALVLALGDGFHLIPRVAAILANGEEKYRVPLGWGKLAASLTMTVFYLLLWRIGARLDPGVSPPPLQIALAVLAAVRILLCLLPQNRWFAVKPPVKWGILRNLPFFLMGLMTAWLYYQIRGDAPGLSLMWIAILLSFAFYLPVVLWSNQNRRIGMLMLPKTCMYVWMLVMLLTLR